MNKTEFAEVIAYLAAGTGKPASIEQTRVYFDLLCDLPLPLVQEAARRSLLEHKYPTLPPVGLIRSHAVSMTRDRTPGPEAWRLAIGAAERYGESNESRGMATLPADVAAAVRAFGWRVLCDARRDELGIVQTQFLKVYATLETRSDRQELMPPMSEKCAAICGTIGLPALEAK